MKAKYAEFPRASPLGPPLQLCPGPTLLGGLQRSADPILISSCLRREKRPLAFYNLEHKNSGITKWLEKPLKLRKSTKLGIFLIL